MVPFAFLRCTCVAALAFILVVPASTNAQQARDIYTPAPPGTLKPSAAKHGMVVAQEKISAKVGADVMAHGGGSGAELPGIAATREDWGKQGQAQIQAIVRKMRLKEAMEALRQHDRFTQDVIIPKLGKYLPATEDWR